LASTSDSPPRKTLRLKKDAEGEEKTADTAAPRKRRPVRWSPLARNRAQSSQAPTPGADGAEHRKTTPKPPRAKRDEAGKPGEAYRQDRPRRKSPATAAERDTATTPPPRRRKPPAPTAQAYFAPCPRGLEALLAEELGELGAADCVPASGGVAFSGDLRLAWQVNLWSRLAIRVLWQVDRGSYRDENDLYAAALKLPWSTWFGHDQTIAVRTVAHASPLKSLNFASLKIKDAVCDRFREDGGPRPDVDTREPRVPILLYLERDQYTLYLDLSGAPLNRRGYRVDPAPAPLNENLAAGLLKLTGWTPELPLLDPMMGGGTLLLEAALLALNIAPGGKRHFTFENLSSFDKIEWTRLRKDALAAAHDKCLLPIYGCDIDPRMVRATEHNLTAAGLADCVQIDAGDVRAIHPPEAHGLLLSNPPYGVRLETDDAAAFYKALGDNLKQRFAGWRAGLLSADPDLPKLIGLKASRRTPLFNGALECRLYQYEIVAGSLRPARAE